MKVTQTSSTFTFPILRGTLNVAYTLVTSQGAVGKQVDERVSRSHDDAHGGPVKAIARSTYGPPEQMQLVELDVPQPGEGDVLIRVHATSLNASDWEILTGHPLYGRMFGFFTPKIRVLGSDVAGTVEAVGSGVTNFRVGDEVYGDIMGRWGGFAEYACAEATMLRRKPSFMSFEQAAALPQSGVIAHQGLVTDGKLSAGQKILINGAGGCGGSFAIQIAKALGAEVTAVDNGGKLELMSSLGADHVIDYAKEDCTRTDRRFDLILDLVGEHGLFDFRRVMAPQSRYAIVGGAMPLIWKVVVVGTLLSLFSKKKMRMLMLKPNEGLEQLEGWIESGAVKPAIERRYELHETPEALRRLGEGRAEGKLVICPTPPR